MYLSLKKCKKPYEPTVRELAARYLEEHVDVHCKKRTAEAYRHHLKNHILPVLGDMKVSNVTRKDIAAFHHSLRKTPYEANHCLNVISKMFNLAELWCLRPDNTNPRKHLKKFRELPRGRYLTKEETKRLGITLSKLKYNKEENLAAVYCIYLLLYTGCRLGEIQRLKWSYVDRENSCLRLPDSKTGARVVYVGQKVIDLIREIEIHPRRPKDNPHVIWGLKPGSYLYNIQKPWRRFRKKSGLDDVRIHDLRHNYASQAISGGLNLAIVGKLLGHTQVQSTARYAHLMADPVREAAQKVAQQISLTML